MFAPSNPGVRVVSHPVLLHRRMDTPLRYQPDRRSVFATGRALSSTALSDRKLSPNDCGAGAQSSKLAFRYAARVLDGDYYLFNEAWDFDFPDLDT